MSSVSLTLECSRPTCRYCYRVINNTTTSAYGRRSVSYERASHVKHGALEIGQPSEIHNYQILTFMHNYVHYRTKLPTVFSHYLQENKLIHRYDTRQRDDVYTHAVETEVGKRAIKYKGSRLWNNLPTDINNIQSTHTFKY